MDGSSAKSQIGQLGLIALQSGHCAGVLTADACVPSVLNSASTTNTAKCRRTCWRRAGRLRMPLGIPARREECRQFERAADRWLAPFCLEAFFVLNDLGRACHGQGEDDDDDAMSSRESSRIEHVKASDSNVGRQALVTGRTNVLCAALSRVSCWS